MDIFLILFPLSITLFIETGIYMILKHKDLKLFLIVSLMNMVLNPLMNLLIYIAAYDQASYWAILIIYEIATTIVESLIIYMFMRFKYLKILLLAFIANLASFLIGVAFTNIYQNKVALIALMLIFFIGYLITYLVVLVSFLKKQSKIASND